MCPPTYVHGGVHGGAAQDVDITERVEDLRFDEAFDQSLYARRRVREVRERRTYAREIGATMTNLNADSANPVAVDSASWDEAEETVIHEESAASDEFTANLTKPFTKVTQVTVRYKKVTGRLTLRYMALTEGGTGLHADFQFDGSDPFSYTSASHVLRSELATGKITVTLPPTGDATTPDGTRIRQISERQTLDGFITAEYEFEFIVQHGTIPPADFGTHLIDIDDADLAFDTPSIADFGNNPLAAEDDNYEVSRSYTLSGSGGEEASCEQVLTVYGDLDFYA